MDFKNASGAWYLKALFLEEVTTDPSSVQFTLKDQDHNGYPSLYRLYLEVADPTEYRFAISCLGGVAHWEALCKCSWFKPYVQRWRSELALKIQSEALAKVLETGRAADPKTSFAANRFLLQGGWMPAETKRGRPSKAEIATAANEIVTSAEQVNDDFKRLLNS